MLAFLLLFVFPKAGSFAEFCADHFSKKPRNIAVLFQLFLGSGNELILAEPSGFSNKNNHENTTVTVTLKSIASNH